MSPVRVLLHMQAPADAMRARKATAMEEFQAGKPAETLTLEGEDTDRALIDTPLDVDAR